MPTRRQLLAATGGIVGLAGAHGLTDSDPTTTITVAGETIPAAYAISQLQKRRGHMFRPVKPDYALVFPWDSSKLRGFHMKFVPFPLEVIWVVDNTVEHTETLDAWSGTATASADTVIELPVGLVDVEEEDTIVESSKRQLKSENRESA